MTPTDVASTLEVLRGLTRIELAVAHFYAACAHTYPEDRELWEGLEDDVQLHAAHLERMAQILSGRPGDFERNQSFSVEKSILESKYGEVVEGTHPEFRALVTELVNATIAHRTRIAAHAAGLTGRR